MQPKELTNLDYGMLEEAIYEWLARGWVQEPGYEGGGLYLSPPRDDPTAPARSLVRELHAKGFAVVPE